MLEMKFGPLSQADVGAMRSLMAAEEQTWLAELDWDYAPIRRILFGFLHQHLLPGFVASRGAEALGYTYFLIARSKGMIGTVYAGGPDAQSIADRLLSRAIESLKETPHVRRIEAQIIPLHGLDLNPVFMRHGFQSFPRHYLELDLVAPLPEKSSFLEAIVPWHVRFAADCAEVAYRSYHSGIDSILCEDYGSVANCESYIRSLVENPGCGIFLPDSSFVGLDSRGTPCGFVLASRLSPAAAMIPQISVHPAHQGRGLGTALIRTAFDRLRAGEYRAARLTVTPQNQRAHEWYCRLGFRNRRDFNAHVWQRE
jgi:ribosomal protein S18 acetylase RimI-like enzyme